jgi:NAD(P)-dependent dehydrogenase (short-subunit alcohol dehydrogenase family)
MMQRLKGKVAVVTGASRGVGRGIALVLGQEGATVFVTGRSTRGALASATRPETIDETAELVTARGGVGIAVRCDHTADAEVEAVFERIRREQGHIDILVNNVWSGYENMENYMAPFWEQPIWRWDAMFDTGARAHFVSSRFAVPLMLPHRRGLIVSTGYLDQDLAQSKHIVQVAKLAVNALTCTMANNLREYGIAVVTLGLPRWVWPWKIAQSVSEALEAGDTLDSLFREHPEWRQGDSPEYAGRAVAALSAEGNVMEKTGSILSVDDLAQEYSFTDIGGRQPQFDGH